MPKDNTAQPTNNIQQPIVADDTPPPMIHDDIVGASVAPNGDVRTPPVVDTVIPPMVATEQSSPKKKFAGGRIIATILGLLLLVGGVGAGITLVGQNQDIRERAGCYSGCVGDGLDPEECDYICDNQGGGSGDTPASGGDYAPPTDEEVAEDQEEFEDNDPGYAGPPAPPAPPAFDPLYGCSSAYNAMMGYCPQPVNGNGCISGGCGNDSGLICHCQGGQSCAWGVCVSSSSFTTACTGDGREPSHNSEVTNAWTCCEDGFEAGPNQQGCYPTTSGGNPPNEPPGDNPTPTPPAITAQCQNVKAYSSTWTLLTSAQLSALTPNAIVNFCVTGSATGGSFDKAKFTINGEVQAETSTVRPTSTDFCQEYVIKNGINSYNVTAQIHHATLGWK